MQDLHVLLCHRKYENECSRIEHSGIILGLDILGLVMSRTKKTVIVDVVIVSSVMWVEGVGRGERG
jgi:hypothetical protein